jgi:restriction endonuclease S subunit
MFESIATNLSWPICALSSGLQINKTSNVAIEDFKHYRIIGVTNRGGGIAVKRTVIGNELTMRHYQRVSANQLMWCKVDTKNGAFGVTREEHVGCLASLNMCLADVDLNVFDPQFLQYFFQLPTVIDGITAASLGTTNRQYLKPQEVLDKVCLRVPLISEQRRIVARIEELAAKINEAGGLRQKAAAEAETVVANEIKTRFDRGRVSGWRDGMLGDYVVDDCYGTSEKTNDDDSGTPVIRMGDIQNGLLDLRDLKYLHVADKDRTKLVLKRGDILVNRTNSAELVGKCAVFNVEGDYAFASYLIRLRLDTEKADPRLVVSYINSPAGRAYMFSERKQMTGQANVNATKLKALPIALPPPAEQCRIVKELDALQVQVFALKKLQAETAMEIDALLPSILDKTFKGKLL